MGRGSSKAGARSGSISGIKATLKKEGVKAAGDMVNDMTKSGDVFILTGKDGNVQMFAKTYNDEYYPMNMGGKGVAANKMDSDAMAQKIASENGTWKVSKYQGEVEWNETKKDEYDTGERKAVIIDTLPTGAKAKQIKKANLADYDVYELSDAPDFFKKVAVKKKR